ncbi:MAG: YdcF family protein [Proteobacteria bacterium]|jgi:uncharacterized SAM-binding protein YcdF (DUF218 family)|nr:YdcF family protein [Alphaproteobacteria bacterium]NCC02552.1 YdcF family protein [Pseudomonadota bacterium]
MTFLRFIRFMMTTGIWILVTVWVIGFSSFVGKVTSCIQPQIDSNLVAQQAIVVLTGGSERVKAGLDLLMADKGQKLLISGVHPMVRSVDSIVVDDDIPTEVKDCCITLGYAANDTTGNAAETKAFMEKEKFQYMILVTAHYHMPRSMMIFERQMPNIKIMPFPVSPNTVHLENWWLHPGTVSLLMREYNKYLWAYLFA